MNSIKADWQPHHLSDDLVQLVPLKEMDFERLFEIAADPLIWEQHPSKDRFKREVFRSYFDGAISGQSAFLIVEKPTARVIGCTRYYDYDEQTSSIAIGFTFLVRDCWGGVYNKSCKRLMLDHAFKLVDNVLLHIGANNIRSQTGTMRFGAKKVREFKATGSEQLSYEYVIRKTEWELWTRLQEPERVKK